MKLVDSDIVWTCEPVIESLDSERLTRPRQVKVDKVFAGCDVYGYGFNSETGEIDDDSNSTCLLTEYNCFATQEEANNRYQAYLIGSIEGLQDELKSFINSRRGES